MRLAGGEYHRAARAETALGPPIVEDALTIDDVVDLVGSRMAVNGGRLSRFPARDADVRSRGARERLVNVMGRRELARGVEIDEVHRALTSFHLIAGVGSAAPTRVPAWRCAAATSASTASSVVSKAHAIRTMPSLGAPRREKV